MCFPGGSAVENLPTNAGDAGLIPGSGRSPRGEDDSPLQCSFLENFLDRRGSPWGHKRVGHN